MPLSERQTLTQYLIEQRRRFPGASGELNALLLDVAIACKGIARAVAQGELGVDPGSANADAGDVNVQGEVQKRLDVISNQMFLRQTEWSGNLAGMASEEMAQPYPIPARYPRGKYLLVFDPLDGSSNLDVNGAVGSIFSILRAPQEVVGAHRDLTEADFLQPGTCQVAAGYALYGPVTMLVLSVGSGVVGFTLDAHIGEFKLTHPNIAVPEDANEFAINTSNSRFWEPPVKRYIDECLAGRSGPRGKDFNMRWIASMVADVHRIMMRGGVFMYPWDKREPNKPGKLRLLYEANPMGWLVEQAGGAATNGRQRILDIQPGHLHERVSVILGSKNEVERVTQYHQQAAPKA